jgi:D-3-phosphoglycerate dehydrogenase
VERESYEMYFSIAFQNILEVLQGNVDSVVNPTALAPALIRA